MALDPKQAAQLKKDLKELNALRDKLGEKPIEVNFEQINLNDIERMKTLLDQARVAAIDLDEGFGGIQQSIKNIVSEWKKGFADPTKDATRSFTKLKGLAEKFADDAKGISEMKGKEVKLATQQIKIERDRLKTTLIELRAKKQLNVEEQALLNNLESEYQVQDDLLNQAEGRLDKEKKIHKAMGLTGAAVKGIAGALEHIGIHAEFFEGVEDKMRKAAESGSKFKTAVAGAKGIFAGIGEALSDPLIQITLISKTLKGLVHLSDEFTKEVSKTGKMLGIAGHEAEHAYHTIEKASSMYYFPEELLEGQQKYNDALGMNLKFNQENAEIMQDLTERLGFSAETAGTLVRISTALGKNFKTVDKNVTSTVNSFNKQNKTGVSLRKVMETIADASAATRFNIKGGEKGLAQAASIAAKYGKSMNEVADSAKSLLNFEDSISSELEAELFIGKDLNLERMRSAALTGDTATLLKEQESLVRKNFKNLKGNVLAQEAFAKSIGMSVEDVAKMAEQQEIMSKMSPRQLQQQQATQAEQAETAKQAEAMDRSLKAAAMEMKKALLPLVQAITPFFIKMAEAMGTVGKSLQGSTGKILLSLVGGFAAFKGIQKVSSMFGGGGGGFMGMGGGVDKPGTGKQGLLSRIMGGGGKIGTNATNPMYVYVVNQGAGGGGGGEDILDSISGKGSKGGTIGKGIFGRLGSKGGRGVLKRALRMKGLGGLAKVGAKSLGKGLLKAGGGIGSLLGGFALDYASSSQLEKASELEQKAKVAQNKKTKEKLMERAKKAKNIGKAADVGSSALTGAGLGATIGSVIPGLGTVVGGAVGGALGAGYGLISNYMADGGIVKSATPAVIGEAGPEAVIPLDKFYEKIDELITVIKQGGNVYLDGTKVGTAMAVSSYKLQ